MHQCIDKIEYFLDFLISGDLLKLVNDMSNQFNHQRYLIFLFIMSELRCTWVDLS